MNLLGNGAEKIAGQQGAAGVARSALIGVTLPVWGWALLFYLATPAAAAPYLPNQLVVGLRSGGARIARTGSTWRERVIYLRGGETVAQAITRLKASGRVVFAVPNYVARATGARSEQGGEVVAQEAAAAAELARSTLSQALSPPMPFVPINEGNAHQPGGWEQLQWNFVGTYGVNALEAWSNLIEDHAAGGKGVVVAVLDTGVAFRKWHAYRRSPGFFPSQFVPGADFVAPSVPPVDPNGHGTFVAGEIAEATNVPFGLTGLAYGVKLMPVRVLNAQGEGNAHAIAQGIRYAVNHHAQVVNLSLEFPATISAADVPELIGALRYAHRHHVLVVAAAGNDASSVVPFPARAAGVVSVGASTEHGCLADYSNYGRHISLVAPGGGPDADLPNDPNCRPIGPAGRDIFQVTLLPGSINRFGIPGGYEGTSMAAPEVSATAALVIASRVLGPHPTPERITARLKATARPLGGSADSALYGAGLLDAAAATRGTPLAEASHRVQKVRG